ncbi:hypothetical protein D3C73_1479890 [compost metagenome]
MAAPCADGPAAKDRPAADGHPVHREPLQHSNHTGKISGGHRQQPEKSVQAVQTASADQPQSIPDSDPHGKSPRAAAEY